MGSNVNFVSFWCAEVSICIMPCWTTIGSRLLDRSFVLPAAGLDAVRGSLLQGLIERKRTNRRRRHRFVRGSSSPTPQTDSFRMSEVANLDEFHYTRNKIQIYLTSTGTVLVLIYIPGCQIETGWGKKGGHSMPSVSGFCWVRGGWGVGGWVGGWRGGGGIRVKISPCDGVKTKDPKCERIKV